MRGYIFFRTDGLSQDFPLQQAARFLKGWKRCAPQQVCDSLPWLALLLIVDWLLGRKLVRYAVCLLIQIDAYLRPSEAVGLTTDFLVKPAVAAGIVCASRWCLSLAPAPLQSTTESGQRDASLVIGSNTRMWLSAIPMQYMKPAKYHLFDFDLNRFGQVFCTVGESCRSATCEYLAGDVSHLAAIRQARVPVHMERTRHL